MIIPECPVSIYGVFDFTANDVKDWSRLRCRSIPVKVCHWLLLLCLVFPFALASNRIDVPVKVNGQIMRFGFDTGAGPEVVLWRDVADLMALSLATQTATTEPIPAGQVRTELSNPVDLEFLGFKSKGVCLTIVKSPEYLKWEIQGLIGWPTVRNNILKFDLGRSGLSVLNGVPTEAEGWLKYRVAKSANTLVIEIPGSDGSTGLVSIDTGSDGSVSLAPRLWLEWKAAHPGPPAVFEAHEMLSTGIAVSEVTAAEHWSIDKLSLSNVILGEAHPSDIALHGANYLATMGYDALRKMTLIVDARNGWAYIQPHDDSPRLGLYNRLGAAFVPDGSHDGAVVARVAAESPAAAVGLRDGDRLLKLNGIEVEHWRKRPGTWPPAFFFNQSAGTRLEMEVQRGSQTVTAHPVLQEILGPKNVQPTPPFDRPLCPDFHFVPPLASLVRRAETLGIPITPQASPREPGFMQKGDTVTVVVTSVDEGKLQQWLVLFAGNELKPKEKKAERKVPVLFTSSGRELRFDNTPAGVAIRTVGPFNATGKDNGVRDEWSGAIVTRDFLALGFDSTALTMRKLSSAVGNSLGFSGRPLPEKEAAANRTRLETAGIGLDGERAFAGGTMAMADFFQIAAQTPGIRDVLREMLDISWKDFLKNPQIGINIQGEVEDFSPGFWGLLPDEPCRSFCFRVDLNGVPRLMCRVAATKPMRPLQTVAGVVGIAASRVDGSGPHVMVRILSTRLAEKTQ